MEKRYPLLPSQEGIYYAWMSKSDATYWNLPVCIAYGLEIDADRLESALRKVLKVRRESHIRIGTDERGKPFQFVDESIVIPITRRVLPEDATHEYIHHHFVRPFHPSEGPLCRFELIETPEHHYLLLDFHHLIADGLTISHLFLGTDLPRAYIGQPLDEQHYGILEQAIVEEQQRESSRYASDRTYHIDRFKTHPFTHLGIIPAHPWGRYLRTSTMVERHAIDIWCERMEVASSTLFSSAFSLALSRFSGERDVSYLSLSHGRGDRRLRSAYGMFVQTLPQRITHNEGDTLADLFAHQRREQYNGLRHSSYPLTRFCDDLHRGTGITFGYQSAMIPEQVPMDGRLYEGKQLSFPECRNELNCTIYVHAEEYEIRVDASEAWYDEAFLLSFAKAMRHVTEQMMSLPMDTPLDQLSMVCDEECRKLEELSEGESMPWPEDKTVVDLIFEGYPPSKKRPQNPPQPSQREGEEIGMGHFLTNHPCPSFGKGGEELVSFEKGGEKLVSFGKGGEKLVSFGKGGEELDSFGKGGEELDSFEKGGRTAIHDKYGTMSYEELGHQVEEVSTALRSRGIGQGDIVALLLPRDRRFVVAALGVMHSGAAYLPLDVSHPALRLQQLIADSHAKMVIRGKDDNGLHNKGLNDYELHGLHELDSKGIEDNRSNGFNDYNESDDNELHGLDGLEDERVKDDALAYIIYTSGSAGKPKGVMVGHRALCHFVSVTARLWHLDEHSRISCHASFAFDASVEDLYPVLTVGGTLYLPDEATRKDLHALRRYIADNKITGGCYSPQFALMLCDGHPLSVDYLCVGGDKMSRRPQVGGRVMNTYGPTEFTVNATYYDVAPDHQGDIPIGQPLPNQCAYVLDYAGKMLPRGIVGELCLGGTQMAQGYWRMPEESAAHFKYHADLGKKLYHTGDLVRWNVDGELEYHGRKDDQIELHGQRIEPGEVERALTSLDGMRQAVVSLQGDTLCVHYTSDGSTDEQELRRQLRTSLPPYMIPQLWQRMERLPLTANDKVDRKGLPRIEPQHQAIVAAKNEREQQLLELFRSILETDAIGVTDNFFDMGGTSLAVLELVERAKERGLHIDYASVYRWGNVRALASHLRTSSSERRPLWHVPEGFSPVVIPSCQTTHRHVGNLLLTGVTGYLGRFVLAEYLRQESGTAYCLVRGKDEASCHERLRRAVLPLLGEEHWEDYAPRIEVIRGDIVDSTVFNALESLEPALDTAIHCAANVNHYAPEDELWRTNVEGTRQMIGFCARHHMPLVHLSTLSIGGIDDEGRFLHLSEKEYFKGQSFLVPYDYSKFMAEHVMIEALGRGELQGFIVRPGFLLPPEGREDLQPERSDLFSSLMLVVKELGILPKRWEKMPLNMSRVDTTARELLSISRMLDALPIHHLRCSSERALGELLRERCPSARVVDDDIFLRTFGSLRQDPRYAALGVFL